MTQSAVTQHISKLEHQVGSRLLIRARDGVALTHAGREFFGLADKFISLEMLIEERLQDHSELVCGHLDIIANAPQPALELISRFSQAYPSIEVDFTLFDWTTSMGMLRDNQVDFGIVTAPAPSDDLYCEVLTSARYVLYCRRDHRLAGQSSVSLRDIQDDVLLLPERGSLTQRVVSHALDQSGAHPKRTVKTTTFPVMKQAILQGVGVGIFLENSATGETDLDEVAIKEMPQAYDTCFVVPKQKLDLWLIQSFHWCIRRTA